MENNKTNLEEKARKAELAKQYSAMLRKRGEANRKAVGDDLYNSLSDLYHTGHTAAEMALEADLRDPGAVPSKWLLTHMKPAFGTMFHERDREAILYWADHIREYPYTRSYCRRPFRTSELSAYAEVLCDMLRSFSAEWLPDLDLAAILNRDISEEALAFLDTYVWQTPGYADWQIAYALDHGNEAVAEAVSRILIEENGMGRITFQLIRGILKSHRADLHELVGKLLLAAKLQEGLRQAICENADCGTPEAFRTILQVIADNDLIRFSSVKRAVGTWLGVMTEETRDLDRISQKSVRLMQDCLDQPEKRAVSLESEDAMAIHIALWSLAFTDVAEAISAMEGMIRTGTRHQLLVAGYFAAQLQNPLVMNRLAKAVLQSHSDKDDVVAVWMPNFLEGARSSLWDAFRTKRSVLNTWFTSQAEAEEFYTRTWSMFYNFEDKKKTYSPCVFPWHEVTIQKSDFAERICTIAALTGDDELIDAACSLIKETDSMSRRTMFVVLLRYHRTPTQRKTIMEALADRETYTREEAFRLANGLKLTPDEYRIAEDHLRFKTADIRKNCTTLLLKQTDGELTETLTRLLGHAKEEPRFAALDMLATLQKDSKRSGIFETMRPRLHEMSALSGLSSKEKTFLETLLPETADSDEHQESPLCTPADRYYPSEFDEAYTAQCARVFGEYFPDSKLPALLTEKGGIKSLWQKVKDSVTPAVACKSAILAAMDLLSLSRLIDAHKNDEYVNHSGQAVLLGQDRFFGFSAMRDRLPLSHLWDGWIKENGITHARLIRMRVLYNAYFESTPFVDQTLDTIRIVFGTGFEKGKELPFYHQIGIILNRYISAVPKEDTAMLASALALWFMKCVPDGQVVIRTSHDKKRSPRDSHAHLLSHRQLSFIYNYLKCENNQAVAHIFPLAVASAERCMDAANDLSNIPEEKFDHPGVVYVEKKASRSLLDEDRYYQFNYESAKLANICDYLYAAKCGVISNRQLCEFALRPENLHHAMSVLSNAAAYTYEQGRQVSERHHYAHARSERMISELLRKSEMPRELSGEEQALLSFAAGIYELLVPTVVGAELRRGDSPSPYSNGVGGICRIYGAEYLAAILTSLGKDTLDRTAYYGYGIGNDRRSGLSYLLSVCIPSDTDSADTLKTALEGKKIPKKRLVEAALYSPEWIPLMGEYLGLPSFASVCYYFMAHMNEKFDDKKRAMIARYTPLSEEELNLGAFDVAWFRSAFEAMGEEDFNLIYDAAKYIADGAKHARARKYADAALGRFTVEDTEKTVSDKRNKDLLMAYALIPLTPLTGEDDLLRRYLYLQRFRKESRQFGSQRIVSEGKAVEMALKNLATNAGYADSMRLTLRMETKVIDDSRALLEPQEVDGVTLHLRLDETGKAEILVFKDGKPLKSIPAKIKKQETVVALTELKKTLTEQYRRARRMLEEAMEDQTAFTLSELQALSEHPVVYPMLKNLVLTNGYVSGFLTADGLSSPQNGILSLPADTQVRIAHPYDLYEQGTWRDFQKHLYEKRITQPYRQVFRELYIKTSEEMETFHSLRYAGNQIQPTKTVATLKTRRWVADVEDGLQKVYYKENIVAQMYAMADWFTPADIEAPTLEWVCFSDRRTGKELKISDIPPVIFSEVMRDVDLAVSVAHAGGVDPETSHSTMDMRAAILSFVLPLFKLDNVRVEGHHVLIEGKLADYSIHLGSGVVHQQGGSMIPVLPVHSQHRGRIFLPFADEDPKTAEIISKVLLFAEDTKIKDPMILEGIQR